MRRLATFLFGLLVVGGVCSDDEGVWNGGFYEWVWGPPGSVIVGDVINVGDDTESGDDLTTPKVQAGPGLRKEFVLNANPLWEKDDSDFPTKGLEGILVKSEPIHACKKIHPHPVNSTNKENEIKNWASKKAHVKTKWILIVDQGKCPIETKMTNAERAGYSAMLILSQDPTSNENLTQISKHKIFGAKIAVQDGVTLIEDYAYPKPIIALLEDIRAQQWGHAAWKIILMTIVALIVVILLIAILVKLWKIYRRRQAAKEAAELRETLKRTLETMPVTIWQPNSVTHGENCQICYSPFIANDIVRTFPCFHRFHQRCVIPRFEKCNASCPVCHYSVLTLQSSIRKPKSAESTPLL